MRERLRFWLFLLIGLANLWRGGMAFYLWPQLLDWPMRVDLRLVGGLYLGWGMGFLVAAWLLRHRRGREVMVPLALAYEGFVWGLSLLTERNAYQQQVWPRNLWLSLLFLVIVAYLARPSSTMAPDSRRQGGSNDAGTATLDAG